MSEEVISRVKLYSMRRVHAVVVKSEELQVLKPKTHVDSLVGWIVAPPAATAINETLGVPLFVSTTQ